MDEKEIQRTAKGAIRDVLSAAKGRALHHSRYAIIQGAIDCGTFVEMFEDEGEETMCKIVDAIQERVDRWRV